MENSLCGVNNMLYEQLQKLDDCEGLSNEELKALESRSKIMCNIASTLVKNASVQLEAMKFINEAGLGTGEVPEMLIPRESNGKKLPLPGDFRK